MTGAAAPRGGWSRQPSRVRYPIGRARANDPAASMTSPDVHTFYRRGQEGHEKAAASLERRSGKLAGVRLILAGLGIVLLGGFIWGLFCPWLWPTFGGLACAFAALVGVHEQTQRSERRGLHV